MEQNPLLQRIKKDNQDLLPLAQQTPVLVALSGGADSVMLLRVLLEVGCTCIAAHCNFHLRGEESMRDERFVRDLCNNLDVNLTVKDFDVQMYQQTYGGSIEMACRNLRYIWFEELRKSLQCSFIAVAHHADDQVETFFLNLVRGTGIKGLAGMSRLNGHIWRPLLNITRAEVVNYLRLINQDYVIDSTNAQNDYRRNRLRNIVLPTLYQQFPHSRDRILDTISNTRNDYKALTELASHFLPDEFHISISSLCCVPQASTLLYYRIHHLGFNREQCDEAVKSGIHGNSGSQFIGRGHILHVNRHSLDIEVTSKTADNVVIPIDLKTNVLSPVHITVSHNNPPFSPLLCNGRTKVAFHIDVLRSEHIVLRHWKQGDRIKPFGLRGSKLLSDLFADHKLDHAEKHNAWLLEADGSILWVIGYRASSLYPVTPESQDYILLQI